MEVPAWLQPWWNWWAGLTALFVWPAISALLSSAAIFFTIWLADRSRRDSRRREAAYLDAAAISIRASVSVLNFPLIDAEEEDYVSEIQSNIDCWEDLGVLDTLKEIDPKVVSSATAIRGIIGARAAAKDILVLSKQLLEKRSAPHLEHLGRRKQTMLAAARILEEQSKEISRSSVFSNMRSIGSRVFGRWFERAKKPA